jgi:hypothetical protein
MMKRAQIINGMMKIIVGHLRIAKRRIIGHGKSLGPLQVLRLVKSRIQHMDLAAGLKTG